MVFLLLKLSIQDFKDDREFKNLSSQTIGSYLLTLNEFQGFCSERELIEVNDITANVIKIYLLYCQKQLCNYKKDSCILHISLVLVFIHFVYYLVFFSLNIYTPLLKPQIDLISLSLLGMPHQVHIL